METNVENSLKQDAELLKPIGRRDLHVIPGSFQEYSEKFTQKLLDFWIKHRGRIRGIEIALREYPDLPVIPQVVEKLRELSKIQKIDTIKINVYRDEEETNRLFSKNLTPDPYWSFCP